MSSILTNSSAMTALESLTQTQKNLQKYQTQVSTGLRIASAADNAAYWSIATKMSSSVGALGAVSDALAESAAMISTMNSALTGSISVLNAIKNDLVAAQEPGADLAKIGTDIAAQQKQLISIGSSANFNGQNWLDTAGGTVNLVSSYDPNNGVSFIAINTTNTQLFDSATSPTAGALGAAGAASTYSVLGVTVTSSTPITTGATGAASIVNFLADVETAISSVTSAASTLGATLTSVNDQQTFISNLSDSLTNGVSSLVDANMNEVSTKLSALQVQQQLGIQALSIANSNTQIILKLFQ
jgi:flagellin